MSDPKDSNYGWDEDGVERVSVPREHFAALREVLDAARADGHDARHTAACRVCDAIDRYDALKGETK